MIDEIIIFEVHSSNINRYVNPFALFLLNERTAKKIVVIYDSFVEEDGIDKIVLHNLIYSRAKDHYISVKRSRELKRIFFNYSYRIADLYWTYRFKKLQIRCYQQQHGMYADFLERSLTGYFSTINRKATYLKYLLFFAINFKLTIFLYMLNKDFLKSAAINKVLSKKHSLQIMPVQSDHLFVWGDYWRDWFFENHFYNSSKKFSNIGNPDYHKFIVDSQSHYDASQVCYIAQTFVEDGRMERADYKRIIDFLANNFYKDLIIKLHPRSDKSIFEEVTKNGGKLTYDFPFSGFYLGHYSSLLALAINRDASVFLLEVNNEKIPEYFANSANKVFKNMGDWVNAVKTNYKNDATKNISFYFENKEEHPYELIQDRLKKDAGNGNI